MDSKKPSLVEAGLAKRSGEGGFAQHLGILQPSPLDAACTCCSRHPMLPTPAAAVTSCSCHTLQPSLDAAITRCSRHGQATRTPPRTARNSRPAMRDTCRAPAGRAQVRQPYTATALHRLIMPHHITPYHTTSHHTTPHHTTPHHLTPPTPPHPSLQTRSTHFRSNSGTKPTPRPWIREVRT